MPARIRRRGASLGLIALLVTVLALAFATPLRAQVVTDPRIAEFDPSPDHWAVLDNGQAAVVRYELAMYSVGAAAPFATVDMGKPNPDADGKIRYNFSAAAANWPLPGGNYEARVSAVGPEGAALSAPSNPFTFTTPGGCTITLSNATVQAPAAGGSYSITVSTGATCGWTATTTLPWVSLWVSSGTGNGTVPFQVQANASASSRSGTITISGQSVTVTQSGATQPAATFGKVAPANGATGQNSAVTLAWSAVADSGYWVCWDTSNNNTCDGTWLPNGGGTGRAITGLAPGTYYWQVRAQSGTGTVDADGGTWWSFAVSGTTQPQPPAAFGKTFPANGATGLGNALTLSWAASTGATGYQVCVDTTNDGACGTAWQSAGAASSLAQSGLAAGTYYWQVRAQNTAGATDANGGAWWSFAVSGATQPQPPTTFGKMAPANGATGETNAVTLTWSAVADAGYWVCWDTTNNNTCDGTWWPNGGGAGRAVTGLAPGTYYWQVRAQTASSTADANSGAWWSFTVGGATQPQPPAAFGKASPANGATGLGSGLTLSWAASTGATGYQVCVDTTNDGACGSAWQSAGAASSLAQSGLAAGTYYWQVRAQNTAGATDANGGAWWSFVVGGATQPQPQPPTTFGKLMPANGASGQGSTVTLTWSAVADAGYWVCWDTSNNNTCDGAWWPNGGGAGRTLMGLPAGTYYWQVRAQTPNGMVDGNIGAWWSFTVGGATPPQPPTAFGKVSPASGTAGLGNGVTLSWGAAAGATSYEVCVDTTNDNACSTTWRAAYTATAAGLSGLAAGTYYWQVRALNSSGMTYADVDRWWTFTVSGGSQPTAMFGKLSPANGTTGLTGTVTLTWSAVADAGYWVCWDTTNNNTCDGTWWPNGGGAGRILTGLPPGTYYWTARAQTASGIKDADSGTWWSFTVR